MKLIRTIWMMMNTRRRAQLLLRVRRILGKACEPQNFGWAYRQIHLSLRKVLDKKYQSDFADYMVLRADWMNKS